MNTHTVSIPDPKRERVAGTVTGREKYTFLYVVMAAVGITIAIFYSSMAHLSLVQSVLLLIGLPLVACAFVFSFMEVRRAAQGGKSASELTSEDANLYADRAVDIKPPTGEPYPHHEYFAESAGFDQGQLTSRIPGSTPFVEAFLERRRAKKRVLPGKNLLF